MSTSSSRALAAAAEREWRIALRFLGKLLVMAILLMLLESILYFAYGALGLAEKTRWVDYRLSGVEYGQYITAAQDTWPSSEPVALVPDFASDGRDIVYFGDSTAIDVGDADNDRRNLPAMLMELLPGWRVHPICGRAYQSEVFEPYCGYLLGRDHLPGAVILPINLRAFSPTWDRKPQWQFEKAKYLLRHESVASRVLLPALATFRAVNLSPILPADYAKAPLLAGDQLLGTVADLDGVDRNRDPESFFRLHFAAHYLYPLTADHRKVAALVRTARLLREAGARAFFYITPIDCETGEHYLGPDFSEGVRQNVDVIQAALAEEGAEALDLSCSLPAERFVVYRQQLHEHLDEVGRGAVAAQVAARVRKGIH